MDLVTILIGTFGMILVVFIPGISLTMALFPKKEDLELIERLGVSLVLGLVPQVILYFGSKNFFVSIDAINTAATILLVSLIGIVVWWIRSRK
jgi:uncharacterized membrane protein